MLLESRKELFLFVQRQRKYKSKKLVRVCTPKTNDTHPFTATNRCHKILPAECEVVDIGKGCHENLTIKTIHNPSMTRNQISKVLQPTKPSFQDGYNNKHQHTLMLKALLNPDAKNPPNGAMSEAKMESGKEWKTAGYVRITKPNI